MESFCLKYKVNFFHFQKNKKKDSIEFFDINSVYKQFKQIQEALLDSKKDFGKLNYFFYLKGKNKEEYLQNVEKKIQQNEKADQKFNITGTMDPNMMIKDVFGIYRNEQDY